MVAEKASDLAKLLELIPHKRPFLFVDEIVEADPDHVVTRYTFGWGESYYQGHFPGHPVTPGVLIVESMCQAGLSIQAFCELLRTTTEDELRRLKCVLVDFQIDFLKEVPPGTRITVRSRKQFMRLGKIRSQVEVFDESGEKVCEGSVSGVVR